MARLAVVVTLAVALVACAPNSAIAPRADREVAPADAAPAIAVAIAAPPDAALAPPPLVGRWRVVGCETSPGDPANCARGEIVFTADHVTVDVPASDHVSRAYRLISASADRIVVDIDGRRSEIAVDATGEARWRAPGLEAGRVGRLSFVREPDGAP